MRHAAARNRRAGITGRQAAVLTLSMCVAAGVAAGAIAGASGYEAVSGSLAGYLQGFGQGCEPMGVLRESALKYGKLFVIIWLLAFLPSRGFLPFGGLAAATLLIFRGAAYGFSAAALACGYGPAGLAGAAMLFLPQGLVLIPAYIFAAYCCVWFINKKSGVRGYLPPLFIGAAASLLAACIDAFVTPALVRGF